MDNDNSGSGSGSKNVRDFLAGLLQSRLYLVFKVTGTEWFYLLSKLAARYFMPFAQDRGEFGVIIQGDDDPAIFYFRRSRISIEDFSRTLGVPRDMLETSEAIQLTPYAGKAEAGLPKPTVNYWGVA